MIALLKLIPGSDLFYGTVIGLVLIVGTGWWLHHDKLEQAKGAAIVTAQDAKLAQVTKQRDDALAAQASHDLDEIGVIYHGKITAPAVPDTGVVCHSSVPPVRRQTAPAPQSGPSDHATPVLSGSGNFDPSGPILTTLRNADAQVTALQATVTTLEQYIAAQSNLP